MGAGGRPLRTASGHAAEIRFGDDGLKDRASVIAQTSYHCEVKFIVLLKNTSKSLALLERLAPYQRRINDVLFEFLDEKRFRELRALAAKLVACGDRAVALTALLLHEAEAA